MSYEAKLRELGHTVEPVELNAGKIMLAVRTGWIRISGPIIMFSLLRSFEPGRTTRTPPV